MALQDIFNKLKITAVDGAVMICVVLAAMLMFFFAAGGSGQAPTACVIEINGEEFARYDLTALAEEKTIEIDNEYGRNTIVIDRHGAAVIYSDCSDCLEVKSGKITASGQSLICLPHRLTVRLEGAVSTDGKTF